MRRFLTLLSGIIALAATTIAFHLLPADLTTPVGWLWIPLFGGTVFINAFGIAAIGLMVPWEVFTHYGARQRERLIVLSAGHKGVSGKITRARPAATVPPLPDPLRKQVA
jgi:hypothetical protein